WLPAPHLLLMLPSQVLVLWHTGWSGALVGMGCLAASAAALYRIAARLGFNRLGRLAVLACFLANPSILYIYTTALTEPVLMAALLGALAGLASWITAKRRYSGGELAVFAGLPAAVAVLTRYEGWALTLGCAAFILFAGWRRWNDIRYGIRMTLSFLSLPLVAMLWWFSYNWTIYGNPVEFAVSDYSAGAQQHELWLAGLLPTKGNPGLSVWTFGWSVLETAGIVLIVLALIGGAVLVLTRGLGLDALLIWLMGLTLPFNVFTLWYGQSTISNDHTLPPGWFNNRYALSVIPFLAMLVGFLFDSVSRSHQVARVRHGRLWLAGGLTALLLVQNLWWLQDLSGRSAVIAEAAERQLYSRDEVEADQYLAEHYTGGKVLMDEVQIRSAPILGLPLTELYNRSSGKYWELSLAEPSNFAKWIYVTTGKSNAASAALQDLVQQTMQEHPERFTNYEVAFQNATRTVYKRVDQ
ncbi:MAG: hypothetical protein PHU75_08470, partial [Candidatus Nanopelagicales bacterium]|nr:hypothetical protein [Candidatus Nanopelagicales bacterium]